MLVYGLLLALLTWAATRVLWRRLRYDLHKIPTPRGYPLLGQTLDMINIIRNNEEECFMRARWMRQLGFPKIFRVAVFGSPILTITDMRCVKSIVLSRSEAFPRFKAPERATRILLGLSSKAPHLAGERRVSPYVKAIRKEYASAMQTSNLKKVWPSLMNATNQLAVKIEEHGTKEGIDLQHLLVRFALDVIGAVAFEMTLGGLDGTCNIPELLIEVGHIFKERLSDPITTTCHKLFPRLEGARKRQRAIDRLTHEYDKITKEILQREAPTDGSRPLWFGLRDRYHSETEMPMSYDSLRAEVALVILAGTDTSAHQLAWLFSILAEHPRVVDKILEELRERGLYGDGAREVVFEDLGELPYLTAVIKEGMRIAYIVMGIMPRVVPHDMTLMGYRVPKGTLVVVPGTRWIGTEKEWGDPEVFRPERWLTDEDMSHVHYLGFSYGPRDCSGQRLAMMEMRLVLIKMLSQFCFETVIPFDELMLSGTNGVVIESAIGIPLKVSPRTAS